MKIKHILIATFFLLSAVPLFLALQYLNDYTGEQYRSQIEDKLSALSQIAKKRVLGAVERIKDNNALISSRTQLRLSLANWQADQSSKDLEKINNIISDAQNSMPTLFNLSVYDEKGAWVTSTGTELDHSPIHAPFVSPLPLIELNTYDEQLFLTSTDGLMLNGQIIGYVKTTFYADFIVDLVRDRSGLGTTGEWLFAVRHDSGDALFAVPLKYDAQAAFKRRVPKNRTDVPITQALLGNEIIMSYAPDYIEQPVLASTRYIGQLDWGLVVKINESEVNELVQETTKVIYLLEVLILILAVVVGFSVSLYVSTPLEKLIAHTDEVATGKLVQYSGGNSLKEVKELTEHFNYMIAALKDMNDNLNQKVLERTDALHQANKQLEELSIRDPLTGLHNRRFLHDSLEKEISRAKRYKDDVTCVMLDIDHFKTVNDTWGHDVGDEVLVSVANYLIQSVRDSDIVARMGGEEFCLVLPSTKPESALAFIERLRVDISLIEFEANGECFSVTCSFGVAHLTEDLDTQNQLLKRADQALYKAKTQGRNRVVEFSMS